jgi:hypothetical protein
MKTKLFSAFVGTVMLAAAGVASAEEPLRLTDSQMDGVNAAGFAIGFATAGTIGDAISVTAAETDTLVIPGLAVALSQSAGIAASTIGIAVSESQSVSAAGL